jgi:hypothetical protein
MSVHQFSEFATWDRARVDVEVHLNALDDISVKLLELFKTTAGVRAIRINRRQLIQIAIRLQDIALDVQPPMGGHDGQPDNHHN